MPPTKRSKDLAQIDREIASLAASHLATHKDLPTPQMTISAIEAEIVKGERDYAANLDDEHLHWRLRALRAELTVRGAPQPVLSRIRAVLAIDGEQADVLRQVRAILVEVQL